MPGDGAKYAFLNTQVSLLSERLLDQEQRQLLLSVPKKELGDILIQAELPDLADSLPDNAAQLEQQLIDQLVKEANTLIRNLSGSGREFIRNWFRRFELINIKFILRDKFSRSSHESIKDLLIDLGSMNSVSISALLQTEDADEFLRQLEQTPYRHMAGQARQAYNEKQALFDVEAVLDSALFNHLNQLTYAIEKEQQPRLRRLLGSVLDQINLSWLMRYRLTYKLDPAHVYFLLSSGGWRLHNKVLLQLAQQDSMELILQMVPSPLDRRLDGLNSIREVESVMIAETNELARQILFGSQVVLTRVFAYLYLREQQLQLIHTVIKGHMFKLDRKLIKRCGNPTTSLANKLEAA